MTAARQSMSFELLRPGDRPRGTVAPSDYGPDASGKWLLSDAFDLATCALIVVLIISVLWTFKDYAVSNDEVVQHQYGKLILDYYLSGFRNPDVFSFDNLYLYGGLFDIVAVTLAHLIPIDVFDLRHILCALIGIGGIAATAATARLVAGPRAGLLATLSLALCGPWYGAMFNHTKDIPFAAAVMGAMLVLIRIGRRMSSPSGADILALGLFLGAALGLRVLGLLIVVYIGFATVLYLPWSAGPNTLRRAAAAAAIRLLPALILAYLVMVAAWPWSALAPMNPIRGLFAFSDFHYPIRTYFAGRIYKMSDVPRAFVPTYILIRVPLLTLAGAAIAVAAALAGIGLDKALAMAGERRRIVASCGAAMISACLLWDASVLYRLHPYENLYYNPLVGGLAGAFRGYDLDYWFNSMPEAIRRLEAYAKASARETGFEPGQVYSVAVCGERVSFERTVTLPQLRWDFKPEWNQSEFFIAPTHMNCDQDLDGKVVATVERFGVPLAYVKDRRSLVKPPTAKVISHVPID